MLLRNLRFVEDRQIQCLEYGVISEHSVCFRYSGDTKLDRQVQSGVRKFLLPTFLSSRIGVDSDKGTSSAVQMTYRQKQRYPLAVGIK